MLRDMFAPEFVPDLITPKASFFEIFSLPYTAKQKYWLGPNNDRPGIIASLFSLTTISVDLLHSKSTIIFTAMYALPFSGEESISGSRVLLLLSLSRYQCQRRLSIYLIHIMTLVNWFLLVLIRITFTYGQAQQDNNYKFVAVGHQ